MFGVQEIDSQSLAEMLNGDSGGVRLVDVRGPAEWAQGAIAGAEFLPLHVLPLQADQLQDDIEGKLLSQLIDTLTGGV